MIPELSVKPRVGVSVAVINGRDVLLVRRDKPPYVGLWSLPGGGVRLGESPADSGRRELMEETGLFAERLVLADVANAVTRDGDHIDAHIVVIVYAALEAQGVLRAGDDAAVVAWVDWDQIDPLTTTPGLSKAIASARRVLQRAHTDDVG